MSTVEQPSHPPWCNRSRCAAEATAGPHESTPIRITAGRGHGRAPRIALVLWAPAKGTPVRIRLITIGDLLINTLDLDLDAADCLAGYLTDLVRQAKRPNGQNT